ncbi:MAG: transcription elongation factor GreB [Reyranellaceae bacterium]
MSKAFTKEDDGGIDDDGADDAAPALPTGTKNYITPEGFAALRDERERLVRVERPEVVKIVSWAASNGDRSENGDYLYGKRRLREIDRRLRFLGKRIESAEVVDPGRQTRRDQVFFGATVSYANMRNEGLTVTIVGVDEVDSAKGRVSWVSPVARALLKARVGDTVAVRTPAGVDQIEVLTIAYPATAG